MTKQIKNVYKNLCTYENLYESYLQARKGKRYRDEILEFSFNLEERLMEISEELKSNTYTVGGYREFFVYEPKQRLIMALPFKDRVSLEQLDKICEVLECDLNDLLEYIPNKKR